MFTSWDQYKDYIYQRNQLFTEMLRHNWKCDSFLDNVVNRYRHQRPEWLSESEFVFRILEVSEFCHTIEDISFLRFLLLSKRLHVLMVAKMHLLVVDPTLLADSGKLDDKTPENFDPIAERIEPK